MSKLNVLMGLALAGMTMAPAFSAAADDQEEHSFKIAARSLQPHAITNPRDVPVFCRDDFNWGVTPARPKPQFMERLDTEGFSGGGIGEIAFLLMSTQARKNFLRDQDHPVVRASLQDLARRYDRADDKIDFMLETLKKRHGWPEENFSHIREECLSRHPDLGQ